MRNKNRRPSQCGAGDGRGLDFFHFFAAAALRGHVPARGAGFRAALRDFDFATAGRVGTPEFITFLKRHCVLLSERFDVSTRYCTRCHSFVRRVVLPECRRLPAGIPPAGVFVRSEEKPVLQSQSTDDKEKPPSHRVEVFRKRRDDAVDQTGSRTTGQASQQRGEDSSDEECRSDGFY